MRALLVVASLLAAPLFLGACGDAFVCPTSPPVDGASCHKRSFGCEAGGSGDHQRCSTISTCTDALTATWSNTKDALCTPQNNEACAADYRSTPIGGDCTTAGLQCDYGEGRCGCLPCGPSGLNWRCRAWGEGIDSECPSNRPALGSDCAIHSLVCRYDDKCTVSLGPDIQCLDRHWQAVSGGAKACGLPTCGI